MPLNSRTPRGFNVDAALEAAELEVGPLLRAAREVEAGRSFTNELERRLLRKAEISAGTRISLQEEAQPVAWHKGAAIDPPGAGAHSASAGDKVGWFRWLQIGRNSTVRLGLAGLVVAVAMVAVLGVSFLNRREQPASGSPAPASGVGVGSTPVSSPLAPSATPETGGIGSSEFVPAGKVRHIIVTHYSAVGAETTDTTKEEIWLTSHGGKLLMNKQVLESAAVPVLLLYTLMDDTSILTYLPSSARGTDASLRNRVYKAPRDDSYLAEYVPDQPLIDKLLRQSNTRLDDKSDYNGRNVVPLRSFGNVRVDLTGTRLKNKYVVEYPVFSDLPGPIAHLFDSPGGDETFPVSAGLTVAPDPQPSEIMAYQLLLDSGTKQVVQQEYVSESTERPNTRRVTGMRITLDETRDASSFPPDLFTFKMPAGAQLVNAEYVVTYLVPQLIVPTPMPSPTPEPAPRITLEQFKALYSNPATRPLILDVRPKDVYGPGHIAGAVSFPESQVDARVGQLPKAGLIVTYCQCVGDTEAVRVAQKLHAKYGYSNDNLRVLAGGWRQWQQENARDPRAYPIEISAATPTVTPLAKP